SNASDDLPEPESPVMTTSASRGIATEMSLRLCSRAPETRICSAEDITPFDCRGANGCSPLDLRHIPASSGRRASGNREREHAAATRYEQAATALARRAELRRAADAGAERHAARTRAEAFELAAVEVDRPDQPAGDDRRAGAEARPPPGD